MYRLVTEDTIEVKIIERAFQKLRLDALVVQQGRLASEKVNLNKTDIQDLIRYGADKVGQLVIEFVALLR